MTKHTLEDQLDKCYALWTGDLIVDFMRDTRQLFSMYEIDPEEDWVVTEVGEDNAHNVRLLRTAYLLCMIADKHAGRLVRLKTEAKHLRKMMHKIQEETEEEKD